MRRAGPVRAPDPKQRWLTFVHNHAKVIVACDFFVVITATFRTLYVFVLMDVGTRRILHHNVTAHPTAEWTLQQFRETLPGDHPYRFVLHDRDSIFSQELDKAVAQLGVRVLRTPVRAPMANAFCERLGGSLRRECLDFLIPINERHLRMIVKAWGIHYNRGRPHSSLGPDIPEPSQESVPASDHRHSCPPGIHPRQSAIGKHTMPAGPKIVSGWTKRRGSTFRFRTKLHTTIWPANRPSASIRFYPMRPAGSWPLISTRKVGSATPTPFELPARKML